MAQLKDTIVRGNLYVSEDIQIGDISILDALAGIEEGGSIEITQTQSDWEENDEAASSYIKNRPFYVSDNILDTVTSLDQTEISGFTQNDGCYGITEKIGELLIEGAIYDVTWDGIAYRGLDCHEDTTIQNGYKCLTIGSENENFTDYPFKITTYSDGTDVYYIIKTKSTSESHTVKAVGNIPEIKKIDKKFLPDIETMDIVYDEKEQILEFVNKTPLPKDVSVDPSLSTRGDAADAKVVGDRLKELEEMAKNGGAQADWNENDETSAAYVKNRPFYTKDPEIKTILTEQTIEFTQNEDYGYLEYTNESPDFCNLEYGKHYNVYINGVSYENLQCDERAFEIFGETSIIWEYENEDEYKRFYVSSMPGYGFGIMLEGFESTSNVIKIDVIEREVVKLDEKYFTHTHSIDEILKEYEDYEEIEFSFSGSNFEGALSKINGKPLINGNVYNVIFDGEYYEDLICFGGEIYYESEEGYFGFFTDKDGNSEVQEPFFSVGCNTEGNHTVTITGKFINYEQIPTQYIPSSIASDWAETNVNNISYIKNKPFNHEYIDKLVYEGTLTPEDSVMSGSTPNNGIEYRLYIPMELNIKLEELTLNEQSRYIVTINGVKYDNLTPNVEYSASSDFMRVHKYSIGAHYDYDEDIVHFTEEYPFNIRLCDNDGFLLFVPQEQEDETLEVTVSVRGGYVNKLPEMYQHQSDWNELADTKASFIKNKPFGEYLEYELIPMIEGVEVIYEEVDLYENFDGQFIEYDMELYSGKLVAGSKYTVIINNIRYDNMEAVTYNSGYVDAEDGIMFGTQRGDLWDHSTKYPFCVEYRVWDEDDNGIRLYIDTSRLQITEDSKFYLYEYVAETKVKTIDPKYIPETVINEKINAIFTLDGTTLTITTI